MSSTNIVPDHNQRRPRHLSLAVWRNPLARPTDRLQAAGLLVVLFLWLIGIPVAATAGSLIWSDVSVTVQQQQQSRTTTSAWLLTDAPRSTDPSLMILTEHGALPATQVVPMPARWAAPDASPRTGTIKTTGGGRVGDQVTIWVDKYGNVTEPPTIGAAAAALTLLAVVGIWLIWGGMLLALWGILRHRLSNKRMAAWEHDWERVEPLWTGR